MSMVISVFFFNDTATTEIYTLSLHDALPISRFWLEDGKDAKVIFLDSEGFFIWEHRIWMDKKPTYITCVRESTDCLVCADGIHILNSADRPQFVGYWTIIDTRTYESKGKTYKNEKRLLRVTGDSIRILEDFKAKQKDLTGLAVAIKRLGERSSAAGNHFDKIRKVDIKKKLGKEAAPFEYKKILAPLSEEDILEMGLGRPVSGSDADLGDVDVSIAEDIL